MTGADQIWKAKTDEQLAEASTQLMTYTGEGETVIRAELKRRGLYLDMPAWGYHVFEVGMQG